MKRARVREIAGGIRLSISTLALEFGVLRETIKRALDRGNVAPAARQRGAAVYRLRDVLATWLRSPESGFDPDKLPPAQRAQHYRAEHERLLHLERASQLCDSLEVEQRIAGAFKAIAQTLENIPDTLERDHGASPAMVAAVADMIDKLRAEMAARLVAEASNGNGDSKPEPAASAS